MDKNKKALGLFMLFLFVMGSIGVVAMGPRGKGLERAKKAVITNE